MGLRMALQTTLQQIEEIQAALTEVRTAMTNIATSTQSFTIGNRRKDQAQYLALVEREKMLMERLDVLTARYKRESGIGGPAVNIGIPRRDY